MFTDRFMSVPTQVYNTKLQELTGKTDYEESFSKINPMDLSEYHRSSDDGQECTQLYLKNGRGFITYLTIEEFEKLLNAWQKQNQ